MNKNQVVLIKMSINKKKNQKEQLTHELVSCNILITGGDEVRYSLKELRARKNMTQAEVAEELGISTQTYNAWERDFSNIAISKAVALADFYKVKVDDLKFRP